MTLPDPETLSRILPRPPDQDLPLLVRGAPHTLLLWRECCPPAVVVVELPAGTVLAPERPYLAAVVVDAQLQPAAWGGRDRRGWWWDGDRGAAKVAEWAARDA